MKRFQKCAIVAIALQFFCQTSAIAGYVPALADVAAYDSNGDFIAYATAAHGVFYDNNGVNGQGEPLLTLLNLGTSTGEVVQIHNQGGSTTQIQISSTGMFSPTDPQSPTDVNLIVGTAFDPTNGWSFVGKTDADGEDGDPFDEIPFEDYASNLTSGELTLISVPEPGSLVIALKAATYYAVYAFEGISGVKSFEFDIFMVTNPGNQAQLPGLSHVSLFREITVNDDGGPGGDGNPLPEPASMAIFGLGALGMGFIARRRRQTSGIAA